MTVNIQSLFSPATLTAGATTYYTAQAQTRLDKLTVSNPSTTVAYSVTINLVPAGGVAGVGNQIIGARNLQPLETWDSWPAIGHVLNVGDFISALASVAGHLVLFGSGTLVSG